MRRFVCILFPVILLLSMLFGCSAKPDAPEPGTEKDGPETETDGGITETEENVSEPDAAKDVEESYDREDGPRYDFPDDVLRRCRNFVEPFNVLPESFENPGELSDYALIFTAAAAIQVEFVPSDDGMSASVPFSKIQSRIREYFGPGAALSEDFAEKDYSPYVLDVPNETLTRYSAGSIGGFFFPYAIIDTGAGYELWLIDLMDPLFFDDADNQDRLFAGEDVEYSEIEPFAAEMQFNIYRIGKGENDRLMLTGFRYENYKEINHVMF